MADTFEYGPISPGRLRLVSLVVWTVLAAGLALQLVVLRQWDTETAEPLVPLVLRRLALLPAWAAVTPLVIRSVARWPLRGPGAVRHALRHGAHGATFIVLTNGLIRLPSHLSSTGFDLAGFGTDLGHGLGTWGPFAMFAWGTMVAIGGWIDALGQQSKDRAVPAVVTPVDAMPLREGDVLRLVPLDEIDLVTADDNYVRVHAAGAVHRSRDRLSRIEAALAADRFLRIHRSAIVRVAAIRSIRPVASGDLEVELIGGERARVARGRRQALESRLAQVTSGAPSPPRPRPLPTS